MSQSPAGADLSIWQALCRPGFWDVLQSFRRGFRRRPGSAQNPEQASLYDFTPLRRTLGELIDFERLNGGDIRLSIMTVDIETGEEVAFDTRRERILLDHVLASAGLIPDFPAREIGGRWLGDGALSANAPVGIVLSEPQDDLICFVIDSFPRKAPRPTSWFEASDDKRI